MQIPQQNTHRPAPSPAWTVLQGEFKISDDPAVMMTTLLGSCISACLWDPTARVGGMNHFLLPDSGTPGSTGLQFGVNAMELLLNGLLSRGAERSRLQVRLFGGAKMFDQGQKIGRKNVEFARWFIDNERIAFKNACIGGTRGRKIRFWPVSGQAQRMFLEDVDNQTWPERLPQRPEKRKLAPPTGYGDVELF